MLPGRLKRIAGVLLLAGSLSACVPALATQDPNPVPTTTPTATAPPAATQAPPAVVPAPVPPAPDPLTCQNGLPFHRIDLADYVCVDLRYHPLFPMSITDMVHAIGLPDIFITTIIPRESGWDPTVRNKYDCRGLVQFCKKQALFIAHGYVWDDAYNPWVTLEMAKVLYDDQGIAPWHCSRCSLRS